MKKQDIRIFGGAKLHEILERQGYIHEEKKPKKKAKKNALKTPKKNDNKTE